MPVVQKNKATLNGHTVNISFNSPVTAGNSIIVYVASNDGNVIITSCTDDKSQSYVVAPDYGTMPSTNPNFLQTQGFFFYNSLGGAKVLTLNVGGRLSGGVVDVFIYEITAPAGLVYTAPPLDPLGGSDNAQTPNSPTPLQNPAMTDMFGVGVGNGQVDVNFVHSNYELVFVVCTVQSATFTGFTPSTYTIDSQGLSQVGYRLCTPVTDPSGIINDLIFNLSISDRWCMSADTFYTTAPANFCGGMSSQVVGQPTIKGIAKRNLAS